jgi:hypothetical protein
MTTKSFFPLLMTVFSPYPLVTFPTEKYNTEHNKIHLKRHTKTSVVKLEYRHACQTPSTTKALTRTVVLNVFQFRPFRLFHPFRSLYLDLGLG